MEGETRERMDGQQEPGPLPLGATLVVAVPPPGTAVSLGSQAPESDPGRVRSWPALRRRSRCVQPGVVQPCQPKPPEGAGDPSLFHLIPAPDRPFETRGEGFLWGWIDRFPHQLPPYPRGSAHSVSDWGVCLPRDGRESRLSRGRVGIKNTPGESYGVGTPDSVDL